ncbi:MAG: septum formation initiator family protein [Bacteroidota bacterium]
MKQLLEKIPPFFKSFYFLATLFFVFWLAVMDNNDLFLQSELRKKESELTASKRFYEDKILEVKNDREALLNNPELLEKVAREKYLMKKETEDLYIIIE